MTAEICPNGVRPAGMPDRDSEPTAGFDAAKVEQGVRLILEGIGEDLDRPGLRATPARVARMYAELTEGLRSDPSEVLDAVFEEGHGELILVREIPLYSLCEHHMVPFVGKAHVAYIPGVDGRITGLSKLARLVTELSRRLQVQERLTVQIADVLEKALEPRGVLVVIEAEHLCMSMRGIRTPGVVTVTSAVRGHLQRDPSARTEAMSLLRGTPPPT